MKKIIIIIICVLSINIMGYATIIPLTLNIELPKDIYNSGEYVMLRMTIRNKSDAVCWYYSDFPNNLEIIKNTGEKITPSIMVNRWDIGLKAYPGLSWLYICNLSEWYEGKLGEGKYIARFFIVVKDGKEKERKLYSNKISFTIATPNNKEDEIGKNFNKLSNDLIEGKVKSKEYKSRLMQIYKAANKTSPYYETLHFMSIYARGEKGEQNLIVLDDIISENPNSPFAESSVISYEVGLNNMLYDKDQIIKKLYVLKNKYPNTRASEMIDYRIALLQRGQTAIVKDVKEKRAKTRKDDK